MIVRKAMNIILTLSFHEFRIYEKKIFDKKNNTRIIPKDNFQMQIAKTLLLLHNFRM